MAVYYYTYYYTFGRVDKRFEKRTEAASLTCAGRRSLHRPQPWLAPSQALPPHECLQCTACGGILLLPLALSYPPGLLGTPPDDPVIVKIHRFVTASHCENKKSCLRQHIMLLKSNHYKHTCLAVVSHVQHTAMSCTITPPGNVFTGVPQKCLLLLRNKVRDSNLQ